MEKGYGFIREKLDIKILILYILRRIPDPITFEELTGLAMIDGATSYFDFAECVAEMGDTGHLRVADGKYMITSKGRRNGQTAENSLSLSVRVLADGGALRHMREKSRSASIKTSHSANAGGGCTAHLSLSDGVGEIFAMSVFAADEEYAAALEKGFRKEAEKIYGTLIGMILG